MLIDGKKIKKVYFDTVKLRSGVYYDTVYLDLTAGTARGTCTTTGVLCGPILNNAYILNFGEQEPPFTPVELLSKIGSDAAIVGTEQFTNRAAQIIEYTNAQGAKERLSIDTYYGIPLRQVKYNSAGEQQEEHTFTRIGVGNVKAADVSFPSGLTVVE